ncbi:MAG: (2Fe-2S)-binding protein [Sulfurimonadaceae bacterium]
MLVCDCNEVYYDAIKEAVKKYGSDIETIKEVTDAGTTCQCCLEEDCEKVELPLPLAIERALAELG